MEAFVWFMIVLMAVFAVKGWSNIINASNACAAGSCSRD